MEITVFMLGESRKISMDEGATGEMLISKLGFTPDGVILISGGKPIPYTETLRDGDEVKVVRVASGG